MEAPFDGLLVKANGMAFMELAGNSSSSIRDLKQTLEAVSGRQPEVKFPALELISIITWSVASVLLQWRRRER